jgi:hypothetical protein
MLPFTPQSADQYLSQYRRGKLDPSEAEATAIRAALACLVDQADFVTIGICAENLASAIAALNGYLKGLDLDNEVLGDAELEAANEACYIKFNSRSQQLYGDRYQGQERGVLLATQADYETTICGVYGHFPLDLFG